MRCEELLASFRERAEKSDLDRALVRGFQLAAAEHRMKAERQVMAAHAAAQHRRARPAGGYPPCPRRRAPIADCSGTSAFPAARCREESARAQKRARLFAGEVLGQVEIKKLVRRNHDLEVVVRRIFLRWLIEPEPRGAAELAKSGGDQFADLEDEKVGFAGREKFHLGDRARRRRSRRGEASHRLASAVQERASDLSICSRTRGKPSRARIFSGSARTVAT